MRATSVEGSSASARDRPSGDCVNLARCSRRASYSSASNVWSRMCEPLLCVDRRSVRRFFMGRQQRESGPIGRIFATLRVSQPVYYESYADEGSPAAANQEPIVEGPRAVGRALGILRE